MAGGQNFSYPIQLSTAGKPAENKRAGEKGQAGSIPKYIGLADDVVILLEILEHLSSLAEVLIKDPIKIGLNGNEEKTKVVNSGRNGERNRSEEIGDQ